MNSVSATTIIMSNFAACFKVFWIILFIAMMTSSCGGLFFFPEKQMVLTPSKLNLEYQERPVITEDGTRLNGWLLQGKPPVKATIIYLHGNAQNISYHIASVHWLPKEHYNVYLYDYRGFGDSQGKSSIRNSIADFSAVMGMLEKEIPVKEQNYIVFGQSLGGAVAIAGVAHNKQNYPIKLLVVDSAFSGFRRIAKEKINAAWMLKPFSGLLGLTVPKRPDLLEEIKLISPVPIVFIHGAEDQIVPSHHSRKLYEAAGQPKAFWLEPQAKHTQSLLHYELRARFLSLLDKHSSDKLN
jgi:pimeloyl-ACP methyl ester carboxylesterase